MSETVEEISAEPTAFEQLNVLLESIEHHPDTAVRDHFRALAYTLLDLHHGAFRRIVEIVSAKSDGEQILREFEADEIVSAVLMVHELTPESFETRVETGLEAAREQLKIYGADIELVSLQNGVARLKLMGSASTANVSTTLLKSEIEKALHEAAPDLLDVEYEDIIAPVRPPKLVQIKPRENTPVFSPTETLVPVIRVNQIPNGEFRVVSMGEINLLFCNLENTVYGFENFCAKDGASLENARFENGILICPQNDCRYDVRHGGRSLTDANLRLVAHPIKVENDVVKIALSKGI